MDFEAELVGWVDHEFQDNNTVTYDEDSLTQQSGVTFGGKDAVLRQLVVIFDSKRIYQVHGIFDIAEAEPDRTVNLQEGTKMRTSFSFNEREYIAKLRFFFTFGATEFTKSGSKQTDAPQSVSVTPEAAPGSTALIHNGERRDDAETSDWGLSKAELCGIEFITTRGRRFKRVATAQSIFKSPFDVEVGSGICSGIIQCRTEDDNKICGIGFLFTKQNVPSDGETQKGIVKQVSNFVKDTIKFGRGLVKQTQLRIYNMIPGVGILFLQFIRIVALQVVVPLYDIVSDFLAAGYYLGDRDVRIVAYAILGFILLPHVIQSIFLIFEMVMDRGEFDEYPTYVVQFYKSTPTPFRLLNHVIKFLTVPLFVWVNFAWFFLYMFYFTAAQVLKLLAGFGIAFVHRMKGVEPGHVRRENIRDDAWSKSILIELFFETVPQVLTQAAALVTLYNREDDLFRNFPVMSSIVVSLINFVSQSWLLSGFMRTATLSFLNLSRIMLSSALDFFPIFGLYKDTMESAVFQFFDNPILLEIWVPLRKILMRNRNLKAVTLILEDTKDWLDMSSQLVDSLEKNEEIKLDEMGVHIDEIDKDRIERIENRMGEFKSKFEKLVRYGKAKKIYVFADSILNMGVVNKPIEEAEETSVEKDGLKWSWDWPDEKSSRVRYRIELLETEEGGEARPTVGVVKDEEQPDV